MKTTLKNLNEVVDYLNAAPKSDLPIRITALLDAIKSDIEKQIKNNNPNYWNWKKIETIKDLPNFNLSVLLYWEKDDKKFAVVGYLKSIDVNGYHWGITQNTGDLFEFFNVNLHNDIQPTHWCEVVTPKE